MISQTCFNPLTSGSSIQSSNVYQILPLLLSFWIDRQGRWAPLEKWVSITNRSLDFSERVELYGQVEFIHSRKEDVPGKRRKFYGEQCTTSWNTCPWVEIRERRGKEDRIFCRGKFMLNGGLKRGNIDIHIYAYIYICIHIYIYIYIYI